MDYEPEFWDGFDRAMLDEWATSTQTTCLEVEEYPSTLAQYIELRAEYIEKHYAQKRSMGIELANNFTAYIDWLLSSSNIDKSQEDQVVFLSKFSSNAFRNEFAEGIAYVKHDLGMVVNNYQYSTAAISHEVLHLVLEEQGKSRECYFEAVHENQYNHVMSSYPIIKKFEC